MFLFQCTWFNFSLSICCFLSHQISIHISLLERHSGGLRFCPPSVHNNLFLFHKAIFYHSRWNLLSTCSLLPTQEMFLLSEGTEFFIAYKFLKRFLFCFSNIFFICDCRYALSSVDMEQRDHDSRTALHVAAAEGTTLHTVTLACHLLDKNQWCLLVWYLIVCWLAVNEL